MTSDIESAFTALEWHDAVLLNVNIDRRSPGRRDEVDLVIEWPNERTQTVRFVDCYAAHAELNFAVLASETIRSAICVRDCPPLADLRARWTAIGVALDDLLCFEISTNSTASSIRIYAKGFLLVDPT